jgi:ankyrin repeat protein
VITQTYKNTSIKVVEDTSSYLNTPTIEIAEHIARDHREMCRFTGLDDIEYKKVEAALDRLTSQIPKPYTRRKLTEKELRDREKLVAIERRKNERREFLWNFLRFDQIDHRRTDIRRGHFRTCKWLLQSRSYLDWIDIAKLNQHTGLLWIKGKPGAGKSTLMKFVLAQTEEVNILDEEVILSFFFHARGVDLQKSTTGMYRSLLWQVLAKLPKLRSCFDSVGLVKGYTKHDTTKDEANDDLIPDTKDDTTEEIEHSNWHKPQWSLEILKDLFEKAVLQRDLSRNSPKSLICFIDALDECEENQIRDMVIFFETLCERAVSLKIRFLVCFSSRHYPNIKMHRGLELVLEHQTGHSQDITDYINSKLEIGHSNLVEQIRHELQEKASGVFMWVVLVVQMLNKEYDSGRIYTLRRKLTTIPGDLHELFRDILTRDKLHRNELRLCIQWVLFSRRPLSPHELYFAILSGVEADVIADLAAEDVAITMQDMKRFILDCSKGLVEVVSWGSHVEFIHESVRDFLLRENGLSDLWTELGPGFRGYSHDIIRQCCVDYIAIASTAEFGESFPAESVEHFRRRIPQPPPPPPPQPYFRSTLPRSVPPPPPPPILSPWPPSPPRDFSPASSLHPVARKFPFLKYAVQNVLHHADLAEEEHVSQCSFLEKFDWAKWLKFSALFSEGEFRPVSLEASPLGIFAENDLPNLINIHPSRFFYFELKDDRYRSPLYASVLTRSHRALHKFLELEVQRQPGLPLLRGLLNELCSGRHRLSYWEDWEYELMSGPKALNLLISSYSGILVPFLLAAGKNLDLICENWHSRIFEAVLAGNETFALQLLAAGLDLKTRDAGSLILLKASTKGWVAVIKTILTNENVDINFCNSQGLTSLGIASQKGFVEIVKFLLHTGKANVNARDCKGRTPLAYTVHENYVDIMKLLIDTGEVDVNVQIPRSRYTTTALAIASRKGYIAMARLLLKTGKAIVNFKDKFGRTPLSSAAERGHHEIVALLLHSRDIDVNSKDAKHRTSLSYAAEAGHIHVLALLINFPKIDLNAGERSGWSPLFYAICRGHQAVVKALLQEDKIEVNLKSSNGLTALILAARTGNVGIVHLLLGKDEVDVNAITLWGVSALSMAKGEKHEAVVETLLASGKIKA